MPIKTINTNSKVGKILFPELIRTFEDFFDDVTNNRYIEDNKTMNTIHSIRY